MKNIISTQKWLPFEEILENGTIKIKNSSFIKILEIVPINFNLKSNLEKEAILNSYKIFLKSCNFDIQILIQSCKENLISNISNIEEINKKESNEKIKKISKQYIQYIKQLNIEKESCSKKYYIILKEENLTINSEKIIINNLEEKSLKVKECLSRCGNLINSVNSKNEIKNILYSLLNSRKYLKIE